MGVPLFALVSGPGSEEGETDVSAAVEVRVESELGVARGENFHLGRFLGEKVRILDEKLEAPVGVDSIL